MGQTISTHHNDWVRKAGLSEKAGLTKEHAALSECLRLLVTHDQVDITMLSGAELMVRRVIMIETAVSRNPRSPNWEGLELCFSPTLSETGAITTQAFEFEAWFAGVQKDHAFVLKQQRLLQEEREAEAKKQKSDNKKKGEQEDS